MKWEYQILTAKDVRELTKSTATFPDTAAGRKASEEFQYKLQKTLFNQLGKDSWELVAINQDGVAYLKRPLG